MMLGAVVTLPIEQAAINLAAAVALSSVIGFERQWHNRIAGLRTNTLVALGAATFVVVSDIVPGEGSPTRIAAQVVSGIGFLGAGLVFREGLSVRDLNTAATLWCSAALGVPAGAGYLAAAGERELWGFPKKLAQPTLRTEIDTLDYGPFRVATGTMGYKHREADLRHVKTSLEAPNFLLNIIPHVDGTPRICELVEYRLEDIVLRGAWTGPAALSLAPHALAPVAELPVREIVSAIHIVADLTLGLGRVDLQRPIRQSLPIGEEGLAT
jgi:hypothetical protein